MIGVLLFSRKEGNISPWAAVRGSKGICVSGMVEGDCIQIELKGGEHNSIILQAVNKDCEFDLPNGVEFIQANHLAIGDKSNVCVDMVV